MKVFRIACTGPCGNRPPGSQNHYSVMVLVPYSDVRLPKDGEPLSLKAREQLLALGRRTCDRMNVSDCQVWAGSCSSLNTCVEDVYVHAPRKLIPEAEITKWLQSLVRDPECVPDVLRKAMEAAENTEALDQLVARCIELRHRPVGQLHSLNEPVPA